MKNQNAPQRPAIRTIVVTIVALAAAQALQLIQIFGPQRGMTPGGQGLSSQVSIAAIAVVAWTMSAILVQLAMLLMPASWNRHLGRDGLVNPFGSAVLGLTALLAYSHATGVVESLRATALIPDTQQGMTLAIASLYLGTAGVIIAAWVIDRFGVGYGFWIILAAKAVADLTTGVMQAASLMPMHGLTEAFAPVFLAVAIIAASVFVTLLVLQQGGRFEIVAWPLLVLTLIDMSNSHLELRDILSVFIPLMILVLVLVPVLIWVFLRRVGLLAILLPVTGLLTVIAVLELWLIGGRTFWLLPPLPASLLVASTAVLTTLWHEWRPRAVLAAQKVTNP